MLVTPRRKGIADDHIPNPGENVWVSSELLRGTAQFSIDGESPAKKKKRELIRVAGPSLRSGQAVSNCPRK
jgi:hypothetical protein